MRRTCQILVGLALVTQAPGLAAQGSVAVGGFDTKGSVGLESADYQALGEALGALLGSRLGERANARIIAISTPATGGQVDLAAARQSANQAGARILVVGSLLDQYGDIHVEARVLDAANGTPMAVVRGSTDYARRDQLAEAIAALADQLTSQAAIGGKPGAVGTAIPVPALVEYGRGIAAERRGDRKEAARAKGRPMRYATKAEWAEARALELRATLAEVNGSHQPGSSGARRKGNQQDALRAEIDKFERLAKVFRRKGE